MWGGRPRPPWISENHVGTAASAVRFWRALPQQQPPGPRAPKISAIIPSKFMDSPIEQSRRLQERYASFTDDELLALAEDAGDLTEVARQALQSEIATRGLQVPLSETRVGTAASAVQSSPNSKPDEDSVDLVSVWRAWDRDELRQVMDALLVARVTAVFGPDYLSEADAFAGSFDHGVDVSVSEWDRQRASSVLAAKMPQPNDDSDTSHLPRCPKCHSEDIVFQGLDDKNAPEGFATSKFNLSCDSCGYQWKDDGVEEEA